MGGAARQLNEVVKPAVCLVAGTHAFQRAGVVELTLLPEGGG
ncbi:hypothetical protein ARZXY2_4552 (plasmid) [Arthrobacter sp. ZXY-2]|nr:hypothetical protein ARZXY2_4552 [Arthrobacter sp. ZXY-2]